MKKILSLLAFLILSSALFAQLESTRWKSRVIIGNPVNVILDFKKDTVSLYNLADSSVIEIMNYTSDDTSFTLTKIDGQSDCDNSTPGKYSYKVIYGVMEMKMLSDNCYDRSSVIDNTKWKSWIERTGIKVENAILKKYTGVYEMDAAHPITVTLENGNLFIEGPNNGLPKSLLTALSNNKFYLRIADVEMDFVKDAQGNVVKLISHEDQDQELKKIK